MGIMMIYGHIFFVSIFLVYRSPAVGIYNLVSRSSSYETPLKHIIAPDRRLKVSRIEIHFSLRFAEFALRKNSEDIDQHLFWCQSKKPKYLELGEALDECVLFDVH